MTTANDTNERMAAVEDLYTASTGGALELSSTVLTRLDTAIDRDPASIAALRTWYDFAGRFDVGGDLAHLDVHRELDDAFIDALLAVRAAAWLDGFRCGHDPLLLVFQPQGAAQR